MFSRACLVLRKKVRPYAEKVTKTRGAGTVLLKADPLFIVLPQSDITGEVIEAFQGVSLTAVAETDPVE